ncbi:hypothetical protein TWF481_004414 [Arthrobotrys musiformis]|uniref:Phospholipase/carboxylesterase/thioesterase domain-containing protein n=1 Tax=Arthrobotrys musiformis TaxID=47236 RepID=A0AAV9WQ86_9PEZI
MAEHEEPLTINPITSPHDSTIIFLHGRGDNGRNVAPFLVFAPVNSDYTPSSRRNRDITIRHLLPRTKFVFPTAARRRLTRIQRGEIIWNQWFDNSVADFADSVDEAQVEGIKESTDYIHQLIREEIESGIPPEKIIIMGISQGCAVGNMVVMRYPGRLGGFAGMCGWLPFISHIEGILKEGGEDGTPGDVMKVLEYVEGRLGNGSGTIQREDVTEMLKTPVFITHGIDDPKVVPKCGERLQSAFRGMGFEEVSWATYKVGHWWCDEQIVHIIAWLGAKGLTVSEQLAQFIGSDITDLGSQCVGYFTGEDEF